MIKQCFDFSDVISVNEHTFNANCGLHVNFWKILLSSFCFVTEKDHFKQKLLLWPQFPFNEWSCAVVH